MKTLEIYKNYGCLTHEKEIVWTYSAEQPTAVTSDKITVVIPDDWMLSQNVYGQAILTAPWGWDYDPDEVLLGHGEEPQIIAYDKDRRYYSKILKVID